MVEYQWNSSSNKKTQSVNLAMSDNNYFRVERSAKNKKKFLKNHQKLT